MLPTHGNAIASFGTCEVCGRVDVNLRAVEHAGRVTYSCVNERACLRLYRRHRS